MSRVKFYQELTLLPDAEITENHIWSKLYQQLHLALATRMADGEKGRVGVSFPQYDNGTRSRLGCKLRIFAENEEELVQIDIKKWLQRYQDYIHITRIRPVPKTVKGYAIYRRYHKEANPMQKARRYAKRHDMSYEEALELFPHVCDNKDLPYVQMCSETNKQKYSLYIECIPQEREKVVGYGSYGLDNQSTVPDF